MQPSSSRSARGALIFVVCGMVLLLAFASSSGAWAESGATLRRGTVPTPTPRVQATATQANAPAPKPSPTRITPPTRTPCVNCATPAPALLDETVPAAVDILVNVGGDEYTDKAGRVWLADQEYVEGETLWGYVLSDADSSTFVGKQAIGATTDSPLYQDERWGMPGYIFEVPDGRYQVTLRWAEQYGRIKRPGQRVFSVKLQGALALKDFDIFAAAGGALLAVDRTVDVTVSKGRLLIDFVPEAENPTVAAIAVQRVLPPTPTRAPTSSATPTDTPAPTDTPSPPTPSPTATPTLTLTPSPTATALPATARSAGVFPQAAAALRSADGGVLVRVPAGAVSETMTLVYIPEDAAQLPQLHDGFRMGSAPFSLQTLSAAGEYMTQTLLREPLTLTVRYTASDVQAAGGDVSRLVLQTVRDGRQWLAMETSADAVAGTLSARTRRLGVFALTVRTAPPATAATGSDVTRGGWPWLVAVVVVVVVVWALVVRLRRRARPSGAEPSTNAAGIHEQSVAGKRASLRDPTCPPR